VQARSIYLDTETGNDPALPTSYRSISLFYTIGKLSENPISWDLTWNKRARTNAGWEFAFRPTHSSVLAAGPPFCQDLWRKEAKRRSLPPNAQTLRYRLDRWPLQTNIPQLPVLLVHTFSSYLRVRTFETSLQMATSSRRCMRAWVTHGGLISPVLSSLYVNHVHSPSHRDILRSYRTALYPAATSNTLRGTDRIFRHYLLSGGDPRYMTHLVATHRSVQKVNCSINGYTGPPPGQNIDLFVRHGVLLYKKLIRPMTDYASRRWVPLHVLISGGYRCWSQVSLPCYYCPLVRK